MQKEMDEIANLAGVFKVLSDPTRLRLFQILLNGFHCNCELSKIMDIRPNLVSHHIHTLMKAGLVESMRSEQDARWIFYSVNEELLASIRQSVNPFFCANGIPEREPVCLADK